MSDTAGYLPPDLSIQGSYRVSGDSLLVSAEAREPATQYPVFTFRFATSTLLSPEAMGDSLATSFAQGLQRQLGIFREEWGIDSTHQQKAIVGFMGVYFKALDGMFNCYKFFDILDRAHAADPSLAQPLILQIQISSQCLSPETEWIDTVRYERARRALLSMQPRQDRFAAAFTDFVLNPDTTFRLHAGRTMIAAAPRSEMARGLLIRSLADHNQYAEIIRVYESFPGLRRFNTSITPGANNMIVGGEAYEDALHLAGRYEDELRLAESHLAMTDTAMSWERLGATVIRFRALAALHRPVNMAEARRLLCCSIDYRGSFLLTYFDELRAHGSGALVDSLVRGSSCLNLENPVSREKYRQWMKDLMESREQYSRYTRLGNAQRLLNSAERAMRHPCVDDATNGLVDVMRPIPDSLYYMAVWGEFAASRGRVAEADSALTYLRKTSSIVKAAKRPQLIASPWWPQYRMALILARLGRRGEAFAQLAIVVREGFPLAMELHTDPVWRVYANDPMFLAAVGH